MASPALTYVVRLNQRMLPRCMRTRGSLPLSKRLTSVKAIRLLSRFRRKRRVGVAGRGNVLPQPRKQPRHQKKIVRTGWGAGKLNDVGVSPQEVNFVDTLEASEPLDGKPIATDDETKESDEEISVGDFAIQILADCGGGHSDLCMCQLRNL